MTSSTQVVSPFINEPVGRTIIQNGSMNQGVCDVTFLLFGQRSNNKYYCNLTTNIAPSQIIIKHDTPIFDSVTNIAVGNIGYADPLNVLSTMSVKIHPEMLSGDTPKAKLLFKMRERTQSLSTYRVTLNALIEKVNNINTASNIALLSQYGIDIAELIKDKEKCLKELEEMKREYNNME